MNIRLAGPSDSEQLAVLRHLLWPEGSREEHVAELQSQSEAPLQAGFPLAWLVADDDNGLLAGFAEVGLRSHADGCDPSRPVGFLEGWFVREEFRREGVGAALLRAAEDWARSLGCREMASDALMDNAISEEAHKALGFEVVDRCIHFRKAL
jgi:aminoglycoside 6'-N-acetyltransferase I